MNLISYCLELVWVSLFVFFGGDIRTTVTRRCLGCGNNCYPFTPRLYAASLRQRLEATWDTDLGYIADYSSCCRHFFIEDDAGTRTTDGHEKLPDSGSSDKLSFIYFLRP